MADWRYFGRTSGGAEIYEIFRIPSNGKALHEQDRTRFPEMLQPDGRWLWDPTDAVGKEELTGDFSEALDEIPEQEVHRLFYRWLHTKWPGRRRESKGDTQSVSPVDPIAPDC